MINNYYLVENNEPIGPFSHIELMERGLTPEWNSALNMPEFHSYFTSQGIYLPTKANAANFWWRLLAYFIDYGVLIIVAAMSAVFLGFIEAYTGVQTDSFLDKIDDFAVNLLIVIVYTLYNAIFESTRAQGSIGKIVCQLKVVDIDGRRIRFFGALIRNLSKILSSILCGIGYLLIFWNDRHQGMHDQMAKTYVIRKTN